MSAFVCSDLHFSVIATLIAPNEGDIQEWANYLKRVNIQSVNYRYKEATRISKCKLHEFNTDYSVDDFASIVNCYLYQSCEKDTMEFKVLQAYLKTCIKGDSNKSQIWSI